MFAFRNPIIYEAGLPPCGFIAMMMESMGIVEVGAIGDKSA